MTPDRPGPARQPCGCFIVLEGVDGSGTSTQAQLLSQALRAAGNRVVQTFEPTDGPVGVLIRQVLQKRLIAAGSGEQRGFDWATMAALFAADRLDHVAVKIRPALQAGAVVVTDRYYLSSYTYQSATAPAGVEALGWIQQLNQRALRPDLTVVLDVPFEIAAQRRHGRGEPEELFERAAVQDQLVKLYAEAERLVPDDRLVHISGEPAAEVVAASVIAELRRAELPLSLP